MLKQLLKPLSVIASLLFICLLLAVPKANAIDDPLGKPNVWAELQKSPVDSVLWAQYFGKPWICMNNNELSDLKNWREELLEIFEIEHSKGSDVVNWEDPKEHVNGKLEFVDHEIEAEKERLSQEMRVYVQELKTYMIEEPSTLKRLKKNILVNFVMIEEVYEEEYRKVGVEYVWYDDKYPKGNYNKQTWVQEKEEELHKLKLKAFEKKKALLVKESY